MMSLLNDVCNWLVPGRDSGMEPDPHHSYGRTLCRSYILRRRQVKTFWLIACFVILLQPVLYVAVVVSLFTTFLSFMYLDESDEALVNSVNKGC